ncbi:hypothetical protein [Pseudodesulfovibrio sediminis]|uniref:LPP20 lipoprotein n=1 Tax=Pseudodesulfovibrio sediminis TaxID=2810563 RepID=A0ABM7P2J6_9BACT|nr:hypothetical protein [Pseudodesulfovibrio sediminis]BCS87003.1 hypothetical protein PSDVSF_02450 [Pseudodesulfovibrio sediminis]
MSFRLYLFIALSLITFSVPAQAFTGFVQYFDNGGTIAWGDGALTVVRGMEKSPGSGKVTASPFAIRKATSLARKQLLGMIMATRIDSRQTVSSYLSGEAGVAAQVRGLVHNSLFTGPGIYDEGGTVKVSETFRGNLADLVFPKTIQFQSGIPPKLSTSLEKSFDFSDDEPLPAGDAASYTGVIIDARGLKIIPALAPVIYGQDGLGAYGTFLVSRENVVNKGLVAYAKRMDKPVLSSRVGKNPLIVKAMSTYGSWRTDLIIPTPMAQLVRAIMENDAIAANCRVVIVVDKPTILQGENSALMEKCNEDA